MPTAPAENCFKNKTDIPNTFLASQTQETFPAKEEYSYETKSFVKQLCFPESEFCLAKLRCVCGQKKKRISETEKASTETIVS